MLCGGKDEGSDIEMAETCEEEMHRCPGKEVREIRYSRHEER